MYSQRDSLVVFTTFLKLVIGSSTNEHLLIEVSWITMLMKCPEGIIKYVDKNRFNTECVCLCITWNSKVIIKCLPSSLHTLFFETGSLTDWLGCLFSEHRGTTNESLPSQHWNYSTGIHAMALGFTQTLGNPIQVLELSQKVFNRGNNLPSWLVSFKEAEQTNVPWHLLSLEDHSCLFHLLPEHYCMHRTHIF